MSQPSADELRILHWNVHSWRDDMGASNVDGIAEFVRATDAHVVSLVEVDEIWGTSSTLDDLAGRVGYASIFVPSFEFGQDSATGGFGNALLSPLPILTVRQRHLLWPPPVFDGTELTEPRSVLLVRFRTHAGPVWIGTTHLPRTEKDARQEALHQLVTATGDCEEPWLLVGDFNTPPSSWLDEHPTWQACPRSTPTYPTQAPTEAIDYCVAPRQLRLHAEVLTSTRSDHLPLLLHIQI
jgi:endonuclease/exonuclease/phosphatase family metal-dependent hydrolase